jgi:hypothetical protein
MARHRTSWQPASSIWILVSASWLLAGSAMGRPSPERRFADRPVAWEEHDDSDVPRAPEPNHLQMLQIALGFRDSVANEADRILAFEGDTPAEDVNALDEVPCSTWYCARHHLRPMTLDELTEGAPVIAPRPPLTILKGKDMGVASGFQVRDAAGRKFMLKFDIARHLGLANSGEMIGSRVFHAAGYNVPGAISLDLADADLRVGPGATALIFPVQKRPITEAILKDTLSRVARPPNGLVRAVAVPWIGGKILGGFDMLGVRRDDPNDRIPHERRRSIRASWVLIAWLSILDPSSINTIDSYVEANGHRFVRHHFFDFGCSFGSATDYVEGLQEDGEYVVEVGRTLASIFTLGLYRRPFQDDAHRQEWIRLRAEHPALGAFPADSFDPDTFRTNLKVPTFMRMTARDAYWGATLVTSFTDEQIAAIVGTARLDRADAEYLEGALRVRRDIIGRRYLRAVTAVEEPQVSADGTALCFEDRAIASRHASPTEIVYQLRISDGEGRPLATFERDPQGPRTCVPIGGEAPGTGYRIIAVTARVAGGAGRRGVSLAKTARVHLRWRAGAGRFAVVGLERDE